MLASPLIRAVSRGKLSVLAFHKVPDKAHPLSPDDLDMPQFENILAAVQEAFNVLPLTDALRLLRAGRLPPSSACITFDDGYAEWVDGVVPVLRRNNAHATFFVTTGQFEGAPLWNERILHAVTRAKEDTPAFHAPELNLPPLRFDGILHKSVTVARMEQAVKYLSLEARQRYIENLEAHTGSRLDEVPTLSWSALRAIECQGFGIGGHSVLHPILSLMAPELALEEMGRSRETLEHALGCRVRSFAYPNGIPAKDIGFEHTQMARQAGYDNAVTTERGVADQWTPMYQIPRFTPWGPTRRRMHFQLMRNMRHASRHLTAPANEKSSLMVAFHFPPQAGSSGNLRTLNFAKHLSQSGWRSTVLSAAPRAYVDIRDDLVDEIPGDVGLVRGFALDAARHLSIRKKYPGALALPDRWGSWWPGACWQAMRFVGKQRPSLIWSTFPIATAHLIGLSIARWTGLPWVADFRDPMVSNDYPEAGLQRRVWRWLEAAVLRHAQSCVFTTERAAQLYRARYPAFAEKCVVIENGYDEDAFTGNQPNREGASENDVLMLHSGIIYPGDRDPSSFLLAIKKLINSGDLDPNRLVIRFRAPHHGDEVLRLAALHGLAAQVQIAPPIPYRQAIAEMLAADLLLVFQGPNFNAQVPAKIYEYLRTGKPVLGMVDAQGDTAAKLAEFRRVYLADINLEDTIADGLTRWMHDDDKEGGVHNIERIRSNSRSVQATKLAAVLDACVLSAAGVRKAPGPHHELAGSQPPKNQAGYAERNTRDE